MWEGVSPGKSLHFQPTMNASWKLTSKKTSCIPCSFSTLLEYSEKDLGHIQGTLHSAGMLPVWSTGGESSSACPQAISELTFQSVKGSHSTGYGLLAIRRWPWQSICENCPFTNMYKYKWTFPKYQNPLGFIQMVSLMEIEINKLLYKGE